MRSAAACRSACLLFQTHRSKTKWCSRCLGMMTSTQLPVPESTPAQARYKPQASNRLRFFRTAALLSLFVHGGALLILVLLQRVSPQSAPAEQGTVELLLVEQKGAQANQAGQPPDPVPPVQAQDKKPLPAPVPSMVPAPPVQAEQGGEPVPEQTKDDRQAPAEPAPAEPARPASKQGPVFSLDGTDSDTNAMVLSGRILPAALDNRFRNRPPPYPSEAAMRGEQGNVLVVIHVSASGLAAGADVAQSSGSASLDEAAIEAVKKWRFHPAMKEGQPIPFDMAIRFDFRPF